MNLGGSGKAALFWGFLALAAAFSLHLKYELRATASDLERVKVGRPAPDFQLNDVDGKPVNLRDVAAANTLVLVNFWATWCKPCRIEMPQLKMMYDKRRADGLEILAVNVGENPGQVRAFLRQNPVPFPVLLDPEQTAANAFSVDAYPTTVIVGRDGNVLRVIRGLDAHLDGTVDYLLKNQSKAGHP